MNTKIKMAVKAVRYAPKPENLVGWYKVPEREHWLVRAQNGDYVGEVFQTAPDRLFYGLMYGRIYPSKSGCAESRSLRDMVNIMTGFVLNRRT